MLAGPSSPYVNSRVKKGVSPAVVALLPAKRSKGESDAKQQLAQYKGSTVLAQVYRRRL